VLLDFGPGRYPAGAMALWPCSRDVMTKFDRLWKSLAKEPARQQLWARCRLGQSVEADELQGEVHKWASVQRRWSAGNMVLSGVSASRKEAL